MKTELLQIRISPELKSVLVDQAAKAGMTASEYVRYLIQKNTGWALRDIQQQKSDFSLTNDKM